ncbi:MAG: antitoxin [Candidatus Parabeggiatoa sp. nov. 1]|nr:MAG: antitoxin [Gammaproteobacteria bacterium]
MNTRISVNPNIHFGKPCIIGTRIPVQSILELVSEGISFAEIVRDYYSNIEITDIKACLQYAIEMIAAEEIHITTEETA